MMTMTTCPTVDELKAFVSGHLPEQESDDFVEHIRSCEVCRGQLETVENTEDSLIVSLRTPDSLAAFDAESGSNAAVAKALGVLAVAGPVALADAENRNALGDEALPSIIGEYELVRPLGRGGMGHVYLARHNKLGREVALKLLASHRLAKPRMRERFENEMRAVGRLSHPNIVTAHDAREIEGTAVLVTEFIDGMDLSELTNRLGRLPIADACEIIRQVAIALQYTHQQGYVHRDVKPSNIMLSRFGEVKLLDLGLARWQLEDNQQADLTGTGQAMGTADYIAPEQVTDSRNVDIRADIYSLGCTLFKLLTGDAPFADERHLTAFAKMTAHVSTPPPSLDDALPVEARELCKLVNSMLAKEPDQRPSEPKLVAEHLARFSGESNLQTLVHQAELQQAAEPKLSPSRGTARRQPLMHQSVPVWKAAVAAFSALLLGLCLGILIKIKYPDGTELTLDVPAGSTITQEFTAENASNPQPSAPGEVGQSIPADSSQLSDGTQVDSEALDAASELSFENLRPLSFAILQKEFDEDALEQDVEQLRQAVDPHRPLKTDLGIWFPVAEQLTQLPTSSWVTQVNERRYMLVRKDPGSLVGWPLVAKNIGINFRGGGRTNTVMEMIFKGRLQRLMKEVTSQHLNGYLAMIVNNRIIHVSKIVSAIDRQAVISGQYAAKDLQFLQQALTGGLVDLPNLSGQDGDASDATANVQALSAVKIRITANWPNTVRAGDGTSFRANNPAKETEQIITYVQKKLDEGTRDVVLEVDPNARYAVVNRVQDAVTKAIGDRSSVQLSLVHIAASDPFANSDTHHPDDPFLSGVSEPSSNRGFANDPFGSSGGGNSKNTFDNNNAPTADPFGGPAANDPFGASGGSDPFGGRNEKDPFGSSPKNSDTRQADDQKRDSEALPDTKSSESQGEFAIISLKSVDIETAIAAVKKFMGHEDLIFDGDVRTNQLWVKASKENLSKVMAFVEMLEKAQAQPPTLGSLASHLEGVWIARDLVGNNRYQHSIFVIEGRRVLTADIQPEGGLAKVRFGDFEWQMQDKTIKLPGLAGKAKFLNDDLVQIVGSSNKRLIHRVTPELPRAFEDFVNLCQNSKCPMDPDSPELVGFANLWMSRHNSKEELPPSEPRSQTPQEAFQEWITPASGNSKEGADELPQAEATKHSEAKSGKGK